MSSQPRTKQSATYLSPTESSARKHINIENFYDGVESTNLATDMEDEAKYKEDLLNSGIMLYTPAKNSPSKFVTAERIRQYQESPTKGMNQSTDPEFLITKSTVYTGGSKDSRSPSANRKGVVEN